MTGYINKLYIPYAATFGDNFKQGKVTSLHPLDNKVGDVFFLFSNFTVIIACRRTPNCTSVVAIEAHEPL